MDDKALALLRCPFGHGRLLERDEGGTIVLNCECCQLNWIFSDGLPCLYREREVRPLDRLMRVFYDGLPSLHDPATRYLLPLMDWGSSEALARRRIAERLSLGELAQSRPQNPVRILEVGIGTGVNIPWIEAALFACPADFPLEIWGVDLSRGMLSACQKNIKKDIKKNRFPVYLALSDVHALPFEDAQFDRVFHVGAMNSFGDPRRALREMARVAKPRTPIVIVDEQLDQTRPNSLWTRLCFRALTFYDRDPHCPTELLPEGAAHVQSEQITRFFYCLRFQME